MLSVKQGGAKYHIWIFSMTWPGIEPRSPGWSANTLLIRPIAWFLTRLTININIYPDEPYILENLVGEAWNT